MKLTISCSYCGAHLLLRLVDFTAARRVNKVAGPITCTSCSSTTQVVLSTKRVRKGAGMKKIEADRAAKYESALKVRRDENHLAGEKLIAETGCTCRHSIQFREYERDAKLSGHDGGHALVTSWSADSKAGGMMPNTPRHLHQRAWRGDAFGSRDAAFEYATPHAVKHRDVASDGSESRSRVKYVPIIALVLMLGGCLTTSVTGDPHGSPTGIGTVQTCTIHYGCTTDVESIESIDVCVPLLAQVRFEPCDEFDAPTPSCVCSSVCEETLKPCVVEGD